MLTTLRRRSFPDVYSQTRTLPGAHLVFQCADNVGLPLRLERDSRCERLGIGLFHIKNSEGLSASRHIPVAIRSSIRHVGCVGGVSTSGTPDGQASGNSRGFSKGSTLRDGLSRAAAGKEAVFCVSPGFGVDHHGPTPSASSHFARCPGSGGRVEVATVPGEPKRTLVKRVGTRG